MPKYQLLAITLISLLITGCSQSQLGRTRTTKFELPRVSDGSGYRTDPFEQWIELRSVFTNDEALAVIIHCKGTIGVVGKWETQTVCWPDISEVEVGYQTVRIQTFDYYGCDSGEKTTERAYWPVDLNQDGLQDLLVVAWGFGEQGIHLDDENGKPTYKRIPYDEPVGLRLIERKSVKGCPVGIRSDKVIGWTDVLHTPSSYLRFIQETRRHCKDVTWNGRLRRMIEALKSEPHQL